jgi:DNA-binding transcriptional MerR regulator
MGIKMNELIKLTDTPKSTILYYVKEGLLPEPLKPKPNLHLYDERCVEIIKFIKYLQNNFDSSINEIKTIVQADHFDLKRGFEVLLETLDIIMGSAHQSSYSSEYVLTHFSISKEQLDYYIDQQLLFKRDGVFTQKELEILEILLHLEDQEVSHELLKAYVDHARALAAFEVAFAKSYLQQKNRANDAVKALFDTTLILKPYLFNMHALNAYRQSEEKQ